MNAKPLLITLVGLTCSLFTGQAYAAPADACSLLTPQQVSAVLGKSVGPGKAIGRMCEWIPPGEPNGINAKKVAVTLLDERGYTYAKMPIPNNKNIQKTPVSGIGDEAVLGTMTGQSRTLTVKRGNSYFSVHVFGFPMDELEAKEKTLALQILSKL
jgi:hypothetical protein